MPRAQRWTLAATIIGSSLTFIDGTVVNVALPALQTHLHATIAEVQWVIEAYALFLGALILVGGSVGDQYGRKRVFLFGVVLFTLASALCGFAGSARALIAARAVQGIGAAFLVPGSLAIITATFDDRSRGRAIGLWSGFSSITSAIGPVVGGWLIDHVSWRAVFFLNVPLAAATVGLSCVFMTESHDPSRAREIDWLGATLATLGLGLVVYALLEGPRLGAFAGRSLVAAGLACLAGFIVVERRSRRPMLSLSLFRSRAFSLTNVQTLLLYGSLAIVLFLVPMNLIQLQKYPATQAGAALLPFALVMFALSRWSGGLVARVGPRLPLTFGPAIAGIGIALYARLDIGGTYWTTFFLPTLVVGLGMAVTVAPLTTTVMQAVAAEHAGVASGINNAVSRLAGLLAIAVLGVVLVSTFRTRVDSVVDSLALHAPLRAAVDRELREMAAADLTAIPLTAAQREEVQHGIARGFVAAFQQVMAAAAVLAFVAGAAGAFLPRAVRSGR